MVSCRKLPCTLFRSIFGPIPPENGLIIIFIVWNNPYDSNSRSQDIPSPKYESWHSQVKLPSVFVQSAFMSQSSALVAHSSSSVTKNAKSIIKNRVTCVYVSSSIIKYDNK